MSRLRRTILCIDDHWAGLISRKKFLEDNGYEVLEATSGKEGLKLLRTYPVDAVVLDYQMPEMTGDEVATKIRQMARHVPIVLLSAYGPLPATKLEAVDTFLTKSHELKLLLPILQDLLNRRSKPFLSRWFDSWRGRNQAVRL